MGKPIDETTRIMIHVAAGHVKPAPLPTDQSVLTLADQDELISPRLLNISRRQGRTWTRCGDMTIGGTKDRFFICQLRGDVMTRERQEEEVDKDERILCVGCAYSRNHPPCCVGQMIRAAWHAAHPDKPRFYTP